MNIIILSSKSSGSSALQKYFVTNHNCKAVAWTEHHENETLYWSKAASILGLPQQSMYRSQVPYSMDSARSSLKLFLKNNGVAVDDFDSKDALYEHFYSLIKINDFRFLEKSPHHLYNESNLQLIHDFISKHNNLEFKVLGLVRHPQAVLYSAWKRWRFIPKEFEKEWSTSYKNLLSWKEKLDIQIIKYEDLASDSLDLDQLLKIKNESLNNFRFKSGSINKWKEDKEYGHVLSKETEDLARQLGYKDFLPSGNKFVWSLKHVTQKLYFQLRQLMSTSN